MGRAKSRFMHRSSSLLLIYLVVSLTFVSALSMRAEATFQAQVYGQDKVPSFRRENDTTTLSVYADSNIVTLVGVGGALNLSCVNATGGGYRCTYVFPQARQSPGTYTLNLQQQTGTPATIAASYVVDGRAPEFVRAEISQVAGTVSAAYSLRDSAASSSAACAGLSSLKLVVNDNVVAKQNLSGCSADGVLAGTVPGLSGATKVYLLASDKLGNSAASPQQTYEMDTLAPALPSSFQLLRNGADVTQISTETPTDVRVTLRFQVTERSLAGVTVDASALTSDQALAQSYRALSPTCREEGGVSVCEASNLKLNPARGALNISITAVDRSGNEARGAAYKTLAIQNAKPSVTYLGRPDRCDECFLANGENGLLAVVEAPGGMRGAGLLMSLDGQPIAARNCTNTAGSTWECVATARVAGGAKTKRLAVLPSSMDDLGNTVAGVLERQLTLDAGKPKILGAPKADTACPTAGQTLRVTAKAQDENSPTLRISANVSEVTDREMVSAQCAPEGNKTFACTLTIDSFLSTHTSGDVPMTISDEAGNAVALKMRLEVCEAATDATPNYIRSLAPAGALPVVDKRIASLIPYRVLVPLKLTMSSDAKVIQVRRVTCDNPFMQRNAYVMNEFSSAPILVAHYKYESAWPNTTVPLNCTLDFSIRRGNTVYVKPETEQLNLSLPVSRQEMGNPGQAIREKEKALVAEINELQEEIGKKAKIDKALGKICTYAEQMGNMNSMMQSLKAVIYVIALATSWAGGSGQALWTAANENLSRLHGFVSNYVWPVGWVSGGSPVGYIVKWTCGLYECKFYDTKTWMSLGLEVATINDWFGAGQQQVTSGDVPPGSTATVDGVSYTRHADGTWRDANNNRLGGNTPVEGAQIHSRSRSVSVPLRSSDGQDLMRTQLTGKNTDPRGRSFYETPQTTKEFSQARKDPRSRGANPTMQNQYEASLMRTQSVIHAIPGDDWIVNPYRSTRYDALCYPAQLYNARKEKQLKCIELKCIRENAVKGLPITQCEERYSAQNCLYLESAQARMHDDIDIGEKMVAAATQIVLGAAVGLAYHTACPQLDDPTLSMVSQWDPLPQGVWSVGCGLAGSLFAYQEFQGFQDSMRRGNPSEPAGTDYCAGVRGVEPDMSMGGGS